MPVAVMGFLLNVLSVIGAVNGRAPRRAQGVQLFGGLPHGAHVGGAGLHGRDDVVVARAAAQVALEPFADGVLVELAALAFAPESTAAMIMPGVQKPHCRP